MPEMRERDRDQFLILKLQASSYKLQVSFNKQITKRISQNTTNHPNLSSIIQRYYE